MTAPDKPGLSNEGGGKPTPGQIGLVDGDKLFAYLIAQAKMGMDERDQERTDALRDVAHILGRFSVGQGSGERDYTPEEALAEAFKRWRYAGFVCLETDTGNKLVCSVGWSNDEDSEVKGVGTTFRAAFASADKAQGGKGERDEPYADDADTL